MKLFDRRGMMIIPNPIREDISSAEKLFAAQKYQPVRSAPAEAACRLYF